MKKICKKTASTCTALMLTAAMILSGPASSVYAAEAASDQAPSLSENGLVTEAEGIAINTDNFPDENFRKYISESCDTGYSYYDKETETWVDDEGAHDGILSPREIEKVSHIWVSDKGIYSLKGIEFFTELEYLDAGNNYLSELDLSANPELTSLTCYCNQLTSLDISGNKNITYLSCGENKLSSLTLNDSLIKLYCSDNDLTNLDVSALNQLVSLDCSKNMLTSLNVTNNIYLEFLNCYNNYLVCLDLSKNNALTSFGGSQQLAVQADFTKSFVKNMADYDAHYDYFDIYQANIDMSQFPEVDISRISFEDKYVGIRSKSGNNLCVSVVYTNDRITEKWFSVHANGREYKTGGAFVGVLLPIQSNGYSSYGDSKFIYNYDCGNGHNMECLIKLDNSPDSAKLGRFIDRLYQVSLDRDGDSDGKSYWVDSLSKGTYTGTEVAFGFVFSPEFKEKNLCNECFVKQLYIAFMGRECDADGLNYWVGLLEGGTTREEVFNGFAGSPEFNGICYSYGIETGSGVDLPVYGTVPTGKCSICQKEDGVTSFIKRLYSICMDRDAEEGGLSYWTSGLWNHELTGYNAAYGFIFCPEFTAKNLSNEQYIEYLYRAFMGRECDADGLAYWMNEMGNGKTKEDIFNSFAGSNEFTMICNRYGIKRD